VNGLVVPVRIDCRLRVPENDVEVPEPAAGAIPETSAVVVKALVVGWLLDGSLAR
jgi:hypothetical protein